MELIGYYNKIRRLTCIFLNKVTFQTLSKLNRSFINNIVHYEG